MRYKLIILLSLFVPALVFSQSAATEIEVLLNTPSVTYAQAARFVLEASDAFVTPNQEDAFNFAMQRKWLPKKAEADKEARLDAISLLCIRSFDMKGGLFYSITKNSHFAYRELEYIGVIQSGNYPNMDVSGDMLLFIINRILGYRERQSVSARAAARAEQRAAREAATRRETLAAEISALLVEQEVSDTTVEATAEGITITLSNIQFPADSAVLPASERVKIQEIANILKNIQDIKLLVAGHTAMAGTADARYNLSLERARSVANYLVSLGAAQAENVTSVGFGADRPVADNATQEGMAANRRVEITILEN